MYEHLRYELLTILPPWNPFPPSLFPPSSPPKFSIPSRKKVTPSFQILLSVFQLPSYCAIPHDPSLAPLLHKAFVPRRRNVTPSFQILHPFCHSIQSIAQLNRFVIWYFVSQTNAKDRAGKSASPTLLPLSEIPPCPP